MEMKMKDFESNLKQLEEAEQKVEILIKNADGTLTETPFPPTGGEPAK